MTLQECEKIIGEGFLNENRYETWECVYRVNGIEFVYSIGDEAEQLKKANMAAVAKIAWDKMPLTLEETFEAEIIQPPTYIRHVPFILPDGTTRLE